MAWRKHAGCEGPRRSVAERSYPSAKVRGRGLEELPRAPEVRGGGRKCQAVTAQERGEELTVVPGHGRRPGGATQRPSSVARPGGATPLSQVRGGSLESYPVPRMSGAAAESVRL